MRTLDRETLDYSEKVFVTIPYLRQLSRLTSLNLILMPFDVVNFEALRLYGDVGKDDFEALSAGKSYDSLFAGLSCTPEKTIPDTGTQVEWFKQLFDDCPAGLPLPHCHGLDTARLLALKTQCDDETKAGGADKPSCTAYEQAFKWKSSYTKAEFQADFIDRNSHYKVTLEVKDGWHEGTDGYENETASLQTLVICLDAQMKEIACPPEKAATVKKANLKYDAAPSVACDGIAFQRFDLDAPCNKDEDCAKALGTANAKCVAEKCAISYATDADSGGNPRLPPGTVCNPDTKTCYSAVEQIFTPRLRSAGKLDFVQDDGKPWEASVSAYKATDSADWCYIVSEESNGKLVPPDYTLRPKMGQKGGECSACYAKDKACGASSDCCAGLTCDKDKKTCQ